VEHVVGPLSLPTLRTSLHSRRLVQSDEALQDSARVTVFGYLAFVKNRAAAQGSEMTQLWEVDQESASGCPGRTAYGHRRGEVDVHLGRETAHAPRQIDASEVDLVRSGGAGCRVRPPNSTALRHCAVSGRLPRGRSTRILPTCCSSAGRPSPATSAMCSRSWGLETERCVSRRVLGNASQVPAVMRNDDRNPLGLRGRPRGDASCCVHRRGLSPLARRQVRIHVLPLEAP
jgi:hypothetical protein